MIRTIPPGRDRGCGLMISWRHFILQRCLACMCGGAARVVFLRVMTDDGACLGLPVCGVGVLYMYGAGFGYRSRFGMWLARYCRTSVIRPNGSMNGMFPSPSKMGSRNRAMERDPKSPMPPQAGTSKAAHGKRRQAFAWSLRKVEVPDHLSHCSVMIRPSLLHATDWGWQVGRLSDFQPVAALRR